MTHRHASLAEAYSALGVEQGASLEVVKTAYKQLALKTHPDKNPGDPDATVQFQRISSAYNLLLKHLDKSTRSSGPTQTYSPHGYSQGFDYDYEDDDDDGFSYSPSEDGYYYMSEEDDFEFFMFLFEEMMQDRANRFARARFEASRSRYDTETEEQYQARLVRDREAREAAMARRKAEEDVLKRERQKEREKEMLAGQQRRKKKSENKRAGAEASRKAAAQKVRTLQEKSQDLRSSAFAAARRGDAAAVKRAIWEDEVDAAGGEIKFGMEDYVKVKPDDPKQTLLHIASKQGDLDLVEWLDTHNAEAEEYDSRHLTPFLIALQHGHAQIARYFLQTYPPEDEDSRKVLTAETVSSGRPRILKLALHSGEPEIVWLVLEAKLVDMAAIRETWSWISGHEAEARKQFGRVGKCKKPFNESAWREVKDLLTSFGCYTPPLTPSEPAAAAAAALPQLKSQDSKTHNKDHGNSIPTPPPDSPSTAFQKAPLHGSYHHTSPRGDYTGRRRGRDGSGRGRGSRRGHGHSSAQMHTTRPT